MDDKVFVRGQSIDFSSSVFNNLLGSPDQDDEEFTKLLEEGFTLIIWRKCYAMRRRT